MNNKTIGIIVVILAVIAFGLVAVYFFQKSPTVGNENEKGQKIVTDEFSVDLISGWQKIDPLNGTSSEISAMAVVSNENITDETVKNIGFKTFFAVVREKLQGTMAESIQAIKDKVNNIPDVSNVTFSAEQDVTINGEAAHVMEVEFTQRGVATDSLIAAVKGSGDDVWLLSFNTYKSAWSGYKDAFYDSLYSFTLKK